MANKKINCPVCRRSYDNTIEFCPYCSNPNPLLNSNKNLDDTGLSDKKRPEKPLPKIKKPVPEPEPVEEDLDEYDTEDEYTPDDEDMEGSPDAQYDSEDESEYEDDEDYSEDDDDESEQEDDDDEEYDGEDGEYDEDDDEEDFEDDEEETEETSSQLINDEKRSPITWADEEKKEAPDMTKAFNEKGEYQPNFDGYYNDTKAKIEGEIESLTQGKEKAIIKVILGVAAVAAVIVYLVLTLY